MITAGEIISRRIAVERLYWLHDRQRWHDFHDRRGRFALFPRPWPTPCALGRLLGIN